MEHLSACLQPAAIVDADHPAVVAFARETLAGHEEADAVTRAVRLYYAVRDGFLYDPYRVDLSPAGLRASSVLAAGRGWCVPKAVLLAAACRASGIAAAVGFADVRNHLSTARMREMMQTDVYYWHGYTAIHLQGQWRKATPAFNLSLCERFGLRPLEFDGNTDSVYHPYDLAGHRHMEYLNLRGEFADVPLERMLPDLARHYPGWTALSTADFGADVEREAAAGR